MDKYSDGYDNNWTHNGSLLMYRSPGFQYHSDIIVVELEDCLIKYTTKSTIYNDLILDKVSIYSDEFAKRLEADTLSKGIIILGNHVNTSKLNIDIIKQKVMRMLAVINIQVIALFALKPNFFMKPHTGLWRMLKLIYNKYGQSLIKTAIVVSNEGGIYIERKVKKHEVVAGKEPPKEVGFSDIDRAFANNIGVPFKSIDEYIGYESTGFEWSTHIIEPKYRQMYADAASKYKNPDILNEIKKLNSDRFAIMIFGPPCSGKTRLANNIIKEFDESPMGEFIALERIGSDLYPGTKTRFKKFETALRDKMSVIIDDNCFTRELRSPYLCYLKKYNIPAICIRVDVGILMAMVFNHTHVETAKTDKVYLYKDDQFRIYRSCVEQPKSTQMMKCITYTPHIDQTKAVMLYRY